VIDAELPPVPATYQKSSALGKAVEHLVAASCILTTEARLNVSTAFVDDEGLDLVFHLRGGSATLAVQVKHNSSTSQKTKRGQLICEARAQTFRPRPDLWMLFVVVDFANATLQDVFFVPSGKFDQLANTTGKGKRRITASLKEGSKDQRQEFRMPFPELPHRLEALLTSAE